jgi:hypothetical protein
MAGAPVWASVEQAVSVTEAAVRGPRRELACVERRTVMGQQRTTAAFEVDRQSMRRGRGQETAVLHADRLIFQSADNGARRARRIHAERREVSHLLDQQVFDRTRW